MQKVKLERATVPLKKLKYHPRNYRHGDVGAIFESIEAHGQFRPLLVQRSTMHVLAGNHTLKAMREHKLTEAEVDFIDCDDEQALRILTADNRASGLATNDTDRLVEILEELANSDGGLAGTLYSGDDLDDLLADLAGGPPEPPEQIDGDLETGTVPHQRVSSRNELKWLSMRAFRANRRKGAIAAFKAAKDAMDEKWVAQIADEVSAFTKDVLAVIHPQTVVTAPPARDAAFKGNQHFATAVAIEAAKRLGLKHEHLWAPMDADRKGHHPRREKDPPKLAVNTVPKRVLVIDDMATSGATIEACAKVLREAGASVTVIVWVYDVTSGEENGEDSAVTP